MSENFERHSNDEQFEDISKLESELKILKADILNFFAENRELNDKEFYDKMIDYSYENKELKDIIKLIIFLSSNIETTNKNTKLKIYQILTKLLNHKEKTLEILKSQKQTITDLDELVSEFKLSKKKNGSLNEKIVSFFAYLKPFFTNKIFIIVFSFTFFISFLYLIHLYDPEFYKDIYQLIKNNNLK